MGLRSLVTLQAGHCECGSDPGSCELKGSLWVGYCHRHQTIIWSFGRMGEVHVLLRDSTRGRGWGDWRT